MRCFGCMKFSELQMSIIISSCLPLVVPTHSKWVIIENLDLWGIFWGNLPILVAWKSQNFKCASLKHLVYFWLLLATTFQVGDSVENWVEFIFGHSTFVIPQNCGQPLSIPSFRCILLHFEANRTMLKIGQNSSSVIHTSNILQNCGQSLSILSFHCILLHFEANWTMLKIGWNSSLVIHTSIILQICGQSLSVPLFCCNLVHLRQIGQCWKFDQNLSPVIHTSIILQNCGQQLSIPSFRLCWKFGLEYIPKSQHV